VGENMDCRRRKGEKVKGGRIKDKKMLVIKFKILNKKGRKIIKIKSGIK
jgi:hypothetical protein